MDRFNTFQLKQQGNAQGSVEVYSSNESDLPPKSNQLQSTNQLQVTGGYTFEQLEMKIATFTEFSKASVLLFRLLFKEEEYRGKSLTGQKGKEALDQHKLAILNEVIMKKFPYTKPTQIRSYHAPLELFVELNKISSDPKIHTLSSDKPVNFIRSEFKGQLPKPFSSHQDATKLIPSDMNDMNKEEISRYQNSSTSLNPNLLKDKFAIGPNGSLLLGIKVIYFTTLCINVNKCHYLIDLDLPNETELEPRYSQRRDEWKILASYKFLDGSSVYCTYVDYNLMKSTRTKRKSQQKMDV
ncbi:hypothetical protein KUTeg_011790 [Tegillarca granosa]|uniref:Uncharacterized protein n=1 Tax=Tegillarca granosa TaxID=220873 RepID=A0ABQ9F1A8_TEGGR|nr:hypothetical protein KUTeg_011790 [Tegillarca granosa]